MADQDQVASKAQGAPAAELVQGMDFEPAGPQALIHGVRLFVFGGFFSDLGETCCI